ncbi:response regulator [Desulfococcaceae bacterium HSG8]|nr:response regulator [Desulfococcaceae bacterium HSG8]
MKNARVMIVEDDFIVVKTIRVSLENSGYAVTSAVPSGEEAIRKAGEEKPDIILMDIMLEGETDGIEAARQIKKLFNIPVIFLTSNVDEDILRRARITEPFGYLVKPFEDRELHANIEMGLYRAEAEKERDRLTCELREALGKVKQLSGLLPICANCKKIRNDQGYWERIEAYITDHSEAEFSHGICPECARKLYPGLCHNI